MSAPGDALEIVRLTFSLPSSLTVSILSPKLHFGAATLSVLHAVAEAPRSRFLHGSESFQERKERGLIIESRIFLIRLGCTSPVSLPGRLMIN